MKLENFLYIDKTGAWAVVAFTFVAGAMVYDTLHCVAEKSAHHHGVERPFSQPADPSVTNRVSLSGSNAIDVFQTNPARPPAPAPTPAEPEKIKKPVPIPNPREIGDSQRSDADPADPTREFAVRRNPPGSLDR